MRNYAVAICGDLAFAFKATENWSKDDIGGILSTPVKEILDYISPGTYIGERLVTAHGNCKGFMATEDEVREWL